MKRWLSLLLVPAMCLLCASCAATSNETGSDGGEKTGLLLPASATYSENGVVLETITYHWGENECKFELKQSHESAPALGVEATYDPTANEVSYLVRNGVGSASADETGVQYSYSDLEFVTYTYDAEDRLCSELFEFGDYVSFAYGEDGTTFSITQDEAVMNGTIDRASGKMSYLQDGGSEITFFCNEYGDYLARGINGEMDAENAFSYEHDENGNLVKVSWEREGNAYELSFTLSESELTHDWQRTVIDVTVSYRAQTGMNYFLFAPLCRALMK